MSLVRIVSLGATASLLFVAGCRSHQMDITVENRTGASARLLEVDYPNASFGANNLAPGTVMHYRIQVTADGPLSLQYTASDGHIVHSNGPAVSANQEGSLEILLLPGGKSDFHPELKR